jgi:hypothetical protein
MMTPLVTEHSVASAADDLKKEGKAVSFRAIRDRIGGGSARIILAHLRTWSVKEANTLAAAAGATITTGDFEHHLREATKKLGAIFQRCDSGEVGRIVEDSAIAGAPSPEVQFSPSPKE